MLFIKNPVTLFVSRLLVIFLRCKCQGQPNGEADEWNVHSASELCPSQKTTIGKQNSQEDRAGMKWQVERILLGTQCNIYYYYPAKS